MTNRQFLAICVLSLCFVADHTGHAQTYQEKAVAAVLMGEAWGEGTTGMLAVGEVIRERSVRLNRTPLKVIAAGRRGIHAFSCLNGTNLDALIRKFAKKPDYQRALRIARIVCRTPEQLPGITQGATHFVLATEQPYWAEGHQPVVVIGAHAFYRLPWI
jgi:spore germination cell wall hydrolase CwlJ-like protein